MKKIMILGASILQVPAIVKAKELGLYVIGVDQNPEAVGFSYCDMNLTISTIDQEKVYQEALRIRPDIIITSTSDAPVRTVSYVNEKMGKPTDISYEDSLFVTNKAFMRKRLQEHSIPIPEFYIVNDYDDLLNVSSHFNDRFILKPADNAGSRGVRLVNLESSDQLWDTFKYCRQYSRSGTLLAEEYLKGAEVSVEAFTVNGETRIVAITDKMVTPPPFFVELGHIEQSELDEDTKKSIAALAIDTIRAVNIRNGPSHTEIKITDKGLKVIEIAARLGGDFITSRLVPLATGIDLVECSIMQALGKLLDLEQKFNRGAAIRFIHSNGKRGRLTEITGIDRANNISGIEEITIYRKIGDELNGLESSNDRIGHIISSATTAAEASSICEQAIGLIKSNFDTNF